MDLPSGIEHWQVVCKLKNFILTVYYNLFSAIIGAGIGGTSCAHYLREIYDDSIEIDIYEGNKVGGRLNSVVLSNGYEYEVGGSIIHDRNKYMSELASLLGELFK